MGLIIKNGLWATLAADIDADDQTLTLTTGHGERFSDLAGGLDYLYATLIDKEAPYETEHVLVNGRDEDQIYVERGEDGSSAKSFPAGSRIECRPINLAIRQAARSAGVLNGVINFGGLQFSNADPDLVVGIRTLAGAVPTTADPIIISMANHDGEQQLLQIDYQRNGGTNGNSTFGLTAPGEIWLHWYFLKRGQFELERIGVSAKYFGPSGVRLVQSISSPAATSAEELYSNVSSPLEYGYRYLGRSKHAIPTFNPISMPWTVENVLEVVLGDHAGLVPISNVTMDGHKFTGLGAGTEAGDSVRFEQLPDVSGLLPKDGSAAMTGALPMGGNKITGIGTPTSNGDAIRVEEYAAIQAAFENTFSKNGDTMAGNINMDGHFIINLPAATGTGEAVTFEQLSTHAMLPPAVDDVVNLTLAFAADAGALTINVHTYNDETPSEENPCIVMMRDANTASGVIHERRITAALSLTIPSGATFGHAGGAAGYVHVYVIDNAGVLELAVSHNFFGASGMMTTTAISSGSNAPTVMYSAVARTNVPVRSIARIFFPSITGSWSTTNLWIDPGERSFPPPHVDIAMGGLKITGLGAATANGDAVRYEQVVGQYLPLAGGTLTGVLEAQAQIRISNAQAVLWKDNAGGLIYPGFVTYDAAHSLSLGAKGAVKVAISDYVSVYSGAPGSLSTPAVALENNTVISWKDNAAGYANAAGVWLDSTNFLNLAAGGASRIHIGSGGMGITVPVVLYSGHISFPATQIPSSGPNTLDDYEEGTFTPNLTFGDVQGAAAYLTQTGTYTKIGNRISFTIVVVVNGKSAATGSAKIGGLPFTAFEYTACASRITGCTGITGTAFAVTTTGTSALLLQGVTTTGGSVALDDTHFNTTPNILIAGTYMVA